MTPDIAIVLAIVAVALVLFSFERIPPDMVALGVMLALVLTGVLPAQRAFAGFGSDTVMLILGLLILSAALVRTGVVDAVGRAIVKRAGDDPNRLLLIVMTACAALSAFVSNTASAAMFVPVVFGIARKAGVSQSKLLMPLAFASILTSSVTLISTTTNVVVSGLMTQYELPPMGMFELAPVGLPITILGIAYMYTLGRRLIPDRAGKGDALEQFGLRPYLSEIVVQPESKIAGKTLAEAGLAEDLGLRVLRIVRGADRELWPRPKSKVLPGDVLLVEGNREDIVKIKDVAGIDIRADVNLADPDLETEDTALVEAMLMPGSPLIGRTLRGSGLHPEHGVQVLAIHRHGGTLLRKFSRIPLRMGDLLLVQGPKESIATLDQTGALRLVGIMDGPRPNLRRARIAVAIFVGVVALGTTGVLPLSVAALLGALAVFATRCITPEEAYDRVEWKVVILIGCMLALGAAMAHTSADRWLAGLVVGSLGHLGPVPLLGGFFILTVLLTQPMSNQAAAVVVVPIAIHTATALDLNPRSFAMMIAVAASCSYLTPLEPACLMVYGPGRYRFMDFVKVGGLLTIVIFVIALLLVPVFWPLALQ
jgi:di/tricarboxylate transporter